MGPRLALGGIAVQELWVPYPRFPAKADQFFVVVVGVAASVIVAVIAVARAVAFTVTVVVAVTVAAVVAGVVLWW